MNRATDRSAPSDRPFAFEVLLRQGETDAPLNLDSAATEFRYQRDGEDRQLDLVRFNLEPWLSRQALTSAIFLGMILGTLLLSYVVGLAWAVVKNVVYWKIFKPDYVPDGWASYFFGTVSGMYVILCWSGLYFGIKYYKGLQLERQRSLKAHAMAHEAQLKMLRYQLNPHFLFNTLNAISTLILDRNNELANVMVTRLSRFLRYTLDNDPMQKSTMSQELKSMDLYLEIEKVRFQDRLRVDFDIGEKASRALVPSLITQPIIENAIKYAVARSEAGETLEVERVVLTAPPEQAAARWSR